MEIVYDTESNGFYGEADTIWCLVAKEVGTDKWWKWGGRDGIARYRDEINELFNKSSLIICHNQIKHDLPLLWELRILPTGEPSSGVVDTLVMSSLLWPDRPVPKGFKSSAGPHSVGAWGYRLGITKPEHEDWTQFSPEMLHRCTEDVRIQEMIYRELLKEKERFA